MFLREPQKEGESFRATKAFVLFILGLKSMNRDLFGSIYGRDGTVLALSVVDSTNYYVHAAEEGVLTQCDCYC